MWKDGTLDTVQVERAQETVAQGLVLLDWAAVIYAVRGDGDRVTHAARLGSIHSHHRRRRWHMKPHSRCDGAAVIYAERGDGSRVTHAAGTRDTTHDGVAGLEGSGNGTSASPPGGCKMEQQNHRVKRRRQTR